MKKTNYPKKSNFMVNEKQTISLELKSVCINTSKYCVPDDGCDKITWKRIDGMSRETLRENICYYLETKIE